MQFSTTKIFKYLETEDYLALSCITADGEGVLTVEAWDGVDWALDASDTVTSTSNNTLFVKGKRMRFTPSGDMVYSIKPGS